MKILIDIPDDNYKFIKDLQSLIIGGRGNCKTIQYNVINAIKNGTPYEERPKGKWRIEAGIGCYCTNCSFDIGNAFDDLMEYVNFCPNCGADMRKEEQ